MRYTIETRSDADVHVFTPKDNTGKIEVVVPFDGNDIYYNVAHLGIQENNLTHREVIVKYYDNTDESPFGITLLRATQLYLSLMDES